MTRLPPWTLTQLEDYLRIALSRLSGADGEPIDAAEPPTLTIRRAGPVPGGRLRIDAEADLSGIGLPADTPLTVVAQPEGQVSWFLGKMHIATLPGDRTPEEAGEAIGGDKLTAAYRRWARRPTDGDRSR